MADGCSWRIVHGPVDLGVSISRDSVLAGRIGDVARRQGTSNFLGCVREAHVRHEMSIKSDGYSGVDGGTTVQLQARISHV